MTRDLDAPPRPSPPLTLMQRAWRWVLAGGWYLLIVLALRGLKSLDAEMSVVSAFVDAAVGLLLLGLAAVRRRAPMLTAVLAMILMPWSFSGAVAGLWVFVSLCTRRRTSEIVTAGIVGVVSQAVAALLNVFVWPQPPLPTPPGGDVEPLSPLVEAAIGGGFWLMTLGIALGIGLYTGARRDLIASLQDRAEQAVREQELRVAQGQADERQRIAREMHDVLAHRISLVSLHAGTLAYRTDLTPEQTREVASIIRENAHASLNELRGVLGSLRGDDAIDKPQPTLAQLPELVAEVTGAGMVIDERCEIELTEVSPTSSRHAYRIVQEALTNARKHAPGARVSLTLTGDAERGLSIEVGNPLRVGGEQIPGAGFGLVGLRERAAVAGGRIDAGVVGSQFKLAAWLPW